jgi:hypothetical protein
LNWSFFFGSLEALGSLAKTWKKSELAIAKLLGGQRVPITGRARGNVPDVAHPWLAIEVKSMKNLPSRVLTAMDQAEKSARFERDKFGLRKLPVAVLHSDFHDHRNDLVVLRLHEFIDHFVGDRSD